MKALSLWQPWASLVAWGLKHVETRDWPTPYRGPLLIHAAMRWTGEEREAAEDLWPAGHLGYVSTAHPAPLPLGAIVAVARLVDCARMTAALIDAQTERELDYGAWVVGRWAWKLEGVVRLDDPIPLRGRQGLFDVDLEREVCPSMARILPLLPDLRRTNEAHAAEERGQ